MLYCVLVGRLPLKYIYIYIQDRSVQDYLCRFPVKRIFLKKTNQKNFVPELPQIKNVQTIFMSRLAPSFFFFKHFSCKQPRRLLRKDRLV